MTRSASSDARTARRLAGPTAILAVGVAAAATVAASVLQAPTRFVVFCGIYGGNRPSHYESADPDVWQACMCETDPREASAVLDRIAGGLGNPRAASVPDGQPCLGGERREKLEAWAARALPRIMSYGFEEPWPDRLGPVVPDHEGREAVRIYADPNYDGNYAGTVRTCEEGVPVDKFAQVSFNLGAWGRVSPDPDAAQPFVDQLVYRMLAHELFHVVQNAQPFYRGAASCPPPLWVMESAADALSVDAMRQRYPNYRPHLRVKGSRSVYGLRPYLLELTSDRRDMIDPWKNNAVPDYTLSSFWTYVADRLFDGKFDYLAAMYDRTQGLGGSVDWLSWLDQGLETVVGYKLYTLFPDFMGNYATWGRQRFARIGERVWLRESFGPGLDRGEPCEEVDLDGVGASDNVEFHMKAISAQCVRVRATGLGPGQSGRVKFMAYDDSKAALDNVHLTTAYANATSKTVNRKFHCLRDSQDVGLHCELPWTIGDVTGEASSRGRAVKAWLGEEFEAEDGQIEMLMLVSHVPLDPTDAEHDTPEVVQIVDLSLAFERTRVTVAGEERPDAQSTVNAIPESDFPPMTGVDADPGGFALAMQAQAPAPPRPGAPNPADGLFAITLSDSDTPGIPGGFQLQLMLLQRPLTYGATGTYPAYVSGSDGPPVADPTDFSGALTDPDALRALMGSAMGGMLLNVPVDDEEGSAVVEVVRFDEDLLHLRIHGTFCRASDYDPQNDRCRNVESFQADVTRAFGWTYDPRHTFETVLTPGTVAFRRHRPFARSGLLSGILDGVDLPSAPPRGGGEPGGGGGGGGAADAPTEFRCDCSCDGWKRLQEINEKLTGEPRTAPPGGDTLQMLACVAQCSSEYRQCARGGG